MSGGIGVGPIEGVVESLVRQDGMRRVRHLRPERGPGRSPEDPVRGRAPGPGRGLRERPPGLVACASDLVIMKPGGLCSSEALALRQADPHHGPHPRAGAAQQRRPPGPRWAARTLLECRSAGEKARSVLDNPAERARLYEGAGTSASPGPAGPSSAPWHAWHGIDPKRRKGVSADGTGRKDPDRPLRRERDERNPFRKGTRTWAR
ncbi:MAG: hypothetical protein M0C28_00075 [Candidatus Moduliflexus flocculans]|nr:hypothetical protein [Candidatus Moduliflexus flocculans]